MLASELAIVGVLVLMGTMAVFLGGMSLEQFRTARSLRTSELALALCGAWLTAGVLLIVLATLAAA